MKIPKKPKKSGKHSENGKPTLDKFFIPKNLEIEVTPKSSIAIAHKYFYFRLK